MRDEPVEDLVVDASVAAKLYFLEEDSDEARLILKSGATLLSSDLLFIEMASVAAKRVRRGLSSVAEASLAVTSVRTLIDYVTPVGELADRAFEIAQEHGLSAYDASYLALAEVSGAKVVTADVKLLRRARDVGFAHHVLALATG